MATSLYVNYIGQTDITLNGAIVAGDTSVNVTIPTVLATFGIVNPSGVGVYKVLIESEIVHFTAGTVTAGIRTWTLARGQEGTTAASHADGTILKLDATAGALGNAVQLDPTAQQSGTVNVSGAITSGGLLTGTGLSAPHASSHDLTGTDPGRDLTRLVGGPPSNGWIASCWDVGFVTSAAAPTAGVVYLTKIMTAHAFTINAIDFYVNQAGTGVTALANCFVGIYDSGGTRRFVSGDQSSAWATNNAKSLSLGGSAYTVSANDFIYIAFLVGTQSTTNVRFQMVNNALIGISMGLTAATFRFGSQLTLQTSLTTPLTLSSNAASGVPIFAAVK